MENNFFKRAEDLNSHLLNNENEYFKSAGDLEEELSQDKIKDDDFELIDDYLLAIVSGKRYESEFGVAMSGGMAIVTLDKLKEMVEEGYNIVRASVINTEKKLIDVEFQKLDALKSETRKGR